MTRSTHVPMRLCIGCGERAPQKALLRITQSRIGSLAVSERGAGGRGGYLHRHEACWAAFIARKGFVRSLGQPVDRAARVTFARALQQREPAARKR